MQSIPHQEPFVPYPLAQLAAAFAIGILAIRFISVPLWALLILTALLSILAFNAFLNHSSVLATLFITLAVMFAGSSLASLEKQNIPADSLRRKLDDGIVAVGDPVELTGVLDLAPELAPESLYLTLRVEKIDFKSKESIASGKVQLLIPLTPQTNEEYKALELAYGARIRVMTALRRADNFRNPGVSSFTEYLERKGYDATGFVKSPLLIERLDNERVLLPLAWLYQARQKVQEQIQSHFSTETAGVLNAALLGNRYHLSHPTAERFREGGTFHVLVISGLHISFIGGLVFFMARRFTKRRVIQFLVSTAVLWGYALAVGAEASVVRAALMFTLVAFAPIVARRAASVNALGAASLLLLVSRPSNLLDPSFQLTFMSVLAIVTLAWPLLKELSAIGSWRPTRDTPYPPFCATWLRNFCECLFWSERQWQQEISQSNYTYKLFKAPLAAKLERYHIQPVARYAFAAIVVSGSVQLSLLPLLIIYFHRLSLASIILNIGVSHLMALTAIVAMIALVLALASSTLAAPLVAIANTLNWLMVHSIDPFVKAGIASLRLPEYSGWPATFYVLYYFPLAIITVLLFRLRPSGQPTAKGGNALSLASFALIAQAIVFVVLVMHPLSAGKADGRLQCDFLDVGQGDSALVTMPDGTTLLVDGGGRPNFLARTGREEDEDTFERETRSIGEAVVSEYLWWRGLDHVDYILATHADADHIDGLTDVARNFSVRAALIARMPRRDPEYAKFSQTMTAKRIPTRLIGAGDILRFGDVTAEVFWPPPSSNEEAPSGNNDSVVLRLHFGERTILLTGDIERGAETAMLNEKQDLRADVVKVAHHGSKTSSTDGFVRATHARIAIISVGQTSVFGHPNRDVVERWKASGAEVLTTGSRGTITVSTNGRDLQLQTFLRQ